MDKQTEFTGNNLSFFSAVRKPDGVNFFTNFDQIAKKNNKVITTCPTERALLEFLLAKIKQLDPDVLVGHNFLGYGLDVLLHRMEALKSRDWSVLGRLKRSKMPKLQSGFGGTGESTWEEKAVTAGRLVCDTYVSSKVCDYFCVCLKVGLFDKLGVVTITTGIA